MGNSTCKESNNKSNVPEVQYSQNFNLLSPSRCGIRFYVCILKDGTALLNRGHKMQKESPHKRQNKQYQGHKYTPRSGPPFIWSGDYGSAQAPPIVSRSVDFVPWELDFKQTPALADPSKTVIYWSLRSVCVHNSSTSIAIL